MALSSTVRLLTLGVLGVLLGGSTASAGWICIKNESNLPVVIQELPEKPNGKLGKAVRLLPGEVYREYQPNPGERLFHLLDLKNTTKPLFFGLLKWPKSDVCLKIRSEGSTVRMVPIVPMDHSDPAIVTVSTKPVP